MTIGPTSFTLLAGIPKAQEEIAIVKDSVTTRLPALRHGEGVEAIPEFKFGKYFMAEDDGTEDMKKMAFMPQKAGKKGRCQWIL